MTRTELMPGAGALALVAVLTLAGLAGPGIAEAAPQQLAWSTFMRAGPGDQYAAIDEIEHSASVDVVGCAGGWCRIQDGRVVGYIDQDALTLAPPPAGSAPPAAAPDCFVTGQVSYLRAAPTRFCATTPRKR
jgi:hypothetical protein